MNKRLAKWFPAFVLMAALFTAPAAFGDGTPAGLDQFKFLWPADAGAPGADMVELRVTAGEQAAMDSPLGVIECLPLELSLPGGEPAAKSDLCFPPAPAGIRAYVFRTEILKDIGAPTESFARPAFALPAVIPPEGYNRVLNFKEDAFAPYTFEPVPTMGPTVLYNDKLEVFAFSSLNYFLSTIQSPIEGKWWCGFQGEVKSIPAGTKYDVLLVQGKGINKSLAGWGDLLRAWYKHERPSNYRDIGLSHLGYWTDNGAYYYYKDAPGMNYHETLIAVKKEADELGVPYGYFQIDSWWYPKATDKNNLWSAFRGGTLLWEPIPELFPRGLAAFVEELGLPLIAHNRWYDRESPYCKKYKCVYGEGEKNSALPIDPAFWDEIMDNAVSYGVEVYEQDWLHTQLYMIPWLREGIANAEQWFGAMVRAADARELTMQLCMASPGFFLENVKFDNITQVRTSGDYHAGAPKTIYWDDFQVTSLLAYSVGLWPFKDNFQTSWGQRPFRNEYWPLEETLISVLSAGLVGPGDKLGHVNPKLLLKTCRQDGVLLKPDKPATPIDTMFLDHHKPWISTALTSHEIGDVVYLAAFNIRPHKTFDFKVSMKELGVEGKYAIYNYRQEKLTLGADEVNFGFMTLNHGFYYILTPVLKNGMAVIGEAEKFVTLSKKRFPSIKEDGAAAVVEIEGVPGEPLTLLVYSPAPLKMAGASRGHDGVNRVPVTIPECGKVSLRVE